ncbi:hypothetical protein [Myceligenerans crystallogenes]|uniref:Uncharacterized protein n=1 Tax=Myceligenerans crystallogenes TaxID=316335 RepID=A0ABN2NFV2_9MICO
MSIADGRRTVSPRELLDLREESWGKALAHVSLVTEALDRIKPAYRQQALEVLGRVYRRADPRDHRRILRRWPAVHVLGTTGAATDEYASNTFWPFLAKSVGASSHTPGFQQAWGTAFLDNLDTLNLPTFEDSDDAGTRYVGRILMHSGMPTSCLPAFFELISKRRAGIAGLSPDAFVAWAAAQAGRGSLYQVEQPVKRFVQYGGEFAVDVTARVFDLLDAVASGGDGSDVALPGRFAAVAQDLHRTGRVLRAARGSTSSAASAADEQPRLRLDPFGFGVVLRLPSASSVGDRATTWIVDADGTRQRVKANVVPPGLDEAPPTDVPLHHPARLVSASIADHEDLTTTVNVVDDGDPLLTFDENGELRSPAVPLPGGHIWFLFPGTPDSLVVNGTRNVRTESPLPPGWAGWSLLLVDLDGVQSVSLAGTESRRLVRSYASARVEIGDPVTGIRTTLGRPVYAGLPSIRLPEELRAAEWEVSLLGADGLLAARWRSGGGGDPDSIWDRIGRPVVGSFTVQVRGPWGRGTSRALDVVEGLRATSVPAWRRFDAGGLQPAKVLLEAARGVTLARNSLDLSPIERETFVRVGAQDRWLTLVVGPPHMTVSHQATDSSVAPSIRPLQFAQEDLTADPGRLILDVGQTADPQLHFLTPGGVQQVVEPGAGRHGVYQFNLAKLTDTLSVHPHGRLALDAEGRLVVGHIRPRRLCSAIVPAGDGLEFVDSVDVEDLTAIVYATTAPWRAPVSLPVLGGRAELPAELRNAGPLLVVVRVEDPWIPADVPEWPGQGEGRLVEIGGYVRSDETDLTALSAFLADEGPEPDAVADLEAVWTARGLARRITSGSRAEAIGSALDRILRSSPREALLAVTESRAPGEMVPSFIVQSGLAWADLADAHDDEPVVWNLRNAVPATLLAAADGEWSDDEVQAAVTVCGSEVLSLLDDGDAFPKAGLLDQSAVHFDRAPAALRDAMLRQMGLIPKGLLSLDARTAASIAFVERRRDGQLPKVVASSRDLLTECRRFLPLLNDPVAVASVDARIPDDADDGWRVVPAISLTYAFAARHAARGHQMGTTWLNGRRKATWTAVAEVAPELVTVDLILAELLVSSTHRTEP